ncbi:hypothetical protein AB6G49_02495 [Staphylococcus haemolyticus]|uniref:hypothetical protein n=1 Tax=Staphylococcus haemolyticus TaxID=1283 RepID=UPI001F5DD75E|nr:hypothetical protein [Staphylococcus haemolyticus]
MTTSVVGALATYVVTVVGIAKVLTAYLLNVLNDKGAVLVDVFVESLTNNVEPKSVLI